VHGRVLTVLENRRLCNLDAFCRMEKLSTCDRYDSRRAALMVSFMIALAEERKRSNEDEIFELLRYTGMSMISVLTRLQLQMMVVFRTDLSRSDREIRISKIFNR